MRSRQHPRFVRSLLFVAACGMTTALAAPAAAVDLVVFIQGVPSDEGQVRCALFAGEPGFPMDSDEALERASHEARPDGVECRWEGLEPGTYAVAANHDVNANGRTDKNWLGIPTEAWGVSNNVRPTLRAPRFDEAAFDLPDVESLELEIRLGR